MAGSTITHDVPDNDLAIARERQVNKPGYAEKIRNRAKAKKRAYSAIIASLWFIQGLYG